MAAPKRRTSHSRKRMRAIGKHVYVHRISSCSNCGADTFSHRLCDTCGFYKGKQIIKIQ